jgi:DeoR family transcriptional regulator, suf operon transcriptional repressor
MQAAIATLGAFRGLRGDILVALKKAQPLTAKELAERFGVTPNALRRHLKELEGSGLVCFRRETHGVGGPRFAYALTELGETLFPRAYERALTGALELVRREHGESGVAELFARHWSEVADEIAPRLASLAPAERVELLAELMSGEGYMAEAVAGDGESVIRQHNCAIRAVAERFPEVCAAEAHFLARVLGAPVERRRHMLAGCNACEYHVRLAADAAPRDAWEDGDVNRDCEEMA